MIRPVFVVALLFVSAATARAECAWVLWQSVINTVPGGSQEWGIMQAVRDQESCDVIRVQHLASFKPSDEWSRVRDTLVHKPRGGGGGFVLRRVCLPDTVDPREVKGK